MGNQPFLKEKPGSPSGLPTLADFISPPDGTVTSETICESSIEGTSRDESSRPQVSFGSLDLSQLA